MNKILVSEESENNKINKFNDIKNFLKKFKKKYKNNIIINLFIQDESDLKNDFEEYSMRVLLSELYSFKIKMIQKMTMILKIMKKIMMKKILVEIMNITI